MNLTRIAALPGTGGGIMAALQLESEPPKPRAAQAPKPAAPSMAHLDVDPARKPKQRVGVPKKKPLNIDDYLNEHFAQKQAGQPQPPWNIRDPGHNHTFYEPPPQQQPPQFWGAPVFIAQDNTGEVNLRLDARTAALMRQMTEQEIAAALHLSAQEAAQMLGCVAEIDAMAERKKR